jgi:hypothetical protein
VSPWCSKCLCSHWAMFCASSTGNCFKASLIPVTVLTQEL